jgi:glutaredoxin-related protein
VKRIYQKITFILFSLPSFFLKEFRLLLAAVGDLVQIVLTELTGQPTVPYVFINGDFIGGSDGE